MVGIAAYLILQVYESIVDVLTAHEFRNYSSVLKQDGTETFQLRFLLTIDEYLIAILQFGTHILSQKFEILVENRLRRYGKHYPFFILAGHRSVYINLAEPLQSRIEILMGIHVGRIHPKDGIIWKDR